MLSLKSMFTTTVIGFTITAASVAAKQNSEQKGVDPSLFNGIPTQNSSCIATTTDKIDGYRVKQYIGVVRGITVREPTIGQGFKADLKGIVGGRISPYIRMSETARQQAYDIMMQRAQSGGANAVIGIKYDSSAFTTGNNDVATEVVCYGTAVVIEPSP